MRYAALAGLLAIAAAAHAVPVTCERTDAVDGGVTLVCKGAAVTPTPPAPPVIPVTPPEPPAPPIPPVESKCLPGESAFICAYRLSNTPAGPASTATTGGGGGSLDGFDLSPGHPKVNMMGAGGTYGFTFQSSGAETTVGYGTAAGTDSGMRVTSWITNAAGAILVSPETRVVANWQPFRIQFPPGSYRLFVQPAATGPLMVEQQ